MKKILFDKTHGEIPKLSDAEPGGLSQLYDELKGAGYSVEPITKDFAGSIGKADVLWVSFPTKDFSADECRAVADFVKAGKGLFVTAELGDIYGNVAKLNVLVKNFGISFKSDCIIDNKDGFVQAMEVKNKNKDASVTIPGGMRVPQFIAIKEFRKHPITDGVGEIGYFAGCSIEPEDPHGVLAWSSDQSFSDLNANARWDAGERVGPACVVYADEIQGGRFACIGDTSILMNSHLKHKDNAKLIMSTMRWLAKDQ